MFRPGPPGSQRWMSAGAEAQLGQKEDFENSIFLCFEGEDGVTHSLHVPGILIRCEKYECGRPFVDANVIGVLPCEVAQEAMVLTNSRHGVSQRDVGKKPRHDPYMSFWADEPKAHWKPSQHTCLFRGYLRVNHGTSVLSTENIFYTFTFVVWLFPPVIEPDSFYY